MLRQLTAGASHLYPGVRLAGPAAADFAHWQAGDAVLVEFADLTLGSGQLAAGPPGHWRLDLGPRSTAKGTPIAAQAWWISATPGPAGQAAAPLRVRRPR